MAKEPSDFIGEPNGATDNQPPPTTPPPAVEAPVEVMPDPDLQIVVEGSVMAAPKGWAKDYRINIGGRNYEHVSDDEHGRWCYRNM